jgi:uncharacterized membrane protein
MVQLLALLDRLASLSSLLLFLPVLNAGSHGSGSATFSLPSIMVTADMVGLCLGCSWTQSRPICMHLTTSLTFDVSVID